MSEFTWGGMKTVLIKYGIPSAAIKADMLMSIVLNRPVLDIFALEDYFNAREIPGESLQEQFQAVFGEAAPEIEKFYGLRGEIIK